MTPGREWLCDRCGSRMEEHNCKITCPNCGYRFDCSDLTLNFEPPTVEFLVSLAVLRPR